ncbi:hypothetical protein ARMSODRAFT_340397 [Armillaria solidipes]|uniref:DUF5648 domain-containing protein n=1 Tax=Armillaria solidipes TaxID=1076256 RepID=A0A2H3BQ44_9AGAR|nr:hypothetical protein ARMSODRAFT_340397 [Armillaria solidipes]
MHIPKPSYPSKMKGLLPVSAIAFLFLGIVSGSQNTHSTIPLLRGYDGGTHDHFYTTSTAEMEHAVTVLNYKSMGVILSGKSGGAKRAHKMRHGIHSGASYFLSHTSYHSILSCTQRDSNSCSSRDISAHQFHHKSGTSPF